MTTAASKRTFFGVQALRGIAAMMVVIHHSTQLWISKIGGLKFNSGWPNGASGVDIFFVISGFVMALSATGEKKPTASRFLGRRLNRIVPLYWLVTFIVTAIGVARLLMSKSASAGQDAAPSLSHVLSSLVFLPSRGADGHVSTVVTVGWTLCFEMFFYLLFAAALYFKITPIRFLTPLMIILSCIGFFHRESWPAFTFFLNPILLEFLAGVFIAYFVKQGTKLSPLLVGILGIAGFIGLLITPDFDSTHDAGRVLFWGVPAFLIVSAAVLLEKQISKRIPKLMLEIGDASYSLYLLHPLVLSVVIIVFAKAHIAYRFGFVFVAACMAAAIVVALLSYRFFEVPVNIKLGKLTSTGASRILLQGEEIIALNN